MRLRADQGYRSAARMADLVEGHRATFAGLPARLVRSGTSRTYLVGSRKRHVILTFSASSERLDALVATMERVLAPTFAEPAVAPK